MVKSMTLFKRKSGLTLEEFNRYWEEEHGPMVLKILPGVRRYVQSHVVDLGKGEPKYDGAAEVWFDSVESYKRAAEFYLSPKGQVIRDDEARFIDKTRMLVIVVEERVMKEAP